MAPRTDISFPQFACLPPELRLSVWQAAISTPCIHLFDVCRPPPDSPDLENKSRALRAFRQTDCLDGTQGREEEDRYTKFKDTLFLDVHRNLEEGDHANNGPPDPSMYKWRIALESVCVDSYMAMAMPSLAKHFGEWTVSDSLAASKRVFTGDVNSVYLPGPDRYVQYNNRTDVLHLCFPSNQNKALLSNSESFNTIAPPSSLLPRCKQSHSTAALAESFDDDAIISLLDVEWNDEMGETLRTARRIAIDAADTPFLVDMDGPIAAEELAMLACTLYHGLEVLYLVDYCFGRCRECSRDRLRAKDLLDRGALFSSLQGDMKDCGIDDQRRPPDVIWGVGRIYREVFDLEQLGWHSKHPAYSFAQALSKVICMQQQDTTQTCQFQGVRVLVVEDE